MNKELKEVILEAGEILREGYYGEKELTFKSEIDLMTQYDMKIELFLKEKLAKIFPDYTIIGEETTKEITHPDKAIYIDPIDGTTNFVHKVPFVAISVGIWENGKGETGVVYNPILNEFFYAEAGKGAFLNGDRIEVSKTETLEHSLIATGFPYTKIEQGKDYHWTMESLGSILPYTRDVRRLGSASIDLCYIAKGVFDGYYEINLKPWDVSAGVIMVEEAGGKISNEKMETYTLDDRIIVATNSRIQRKVAEKIRSL